MIGRDWNQTLFLDYLSYNNYIKTITASIYAKEFGHPRDNINIDCIILSPLITQLGCFTKALQSSGKLIPTGTREVWITLGTNGPN